MVARSQEIFLAIAIARKFFESSCVLRVVVHCAVSIKKSEPCRHNKGGSALYNSY
jgi:hypothetical protein